MGVGERAHWQEEGSLLPFGSSLTVAANAANDDVPGGEEVSANDTINKEYWEPPPPPGSVVICSRSGQSQPTMLTG